MTLRLSPILLFTLSAAAQTYDCPDGWTDFNALCYRSLPGPADQPTAQAMCQEEDAAAVLPSIHDLATNSILLGLSGNLPFWTGLTNSTGGGQGQWSWQDG